MKNVFSYEIICRTNNDRFTISISFIIDELNLSNYILIYRCFKLTICNGTFLKLFKFILTIIILQIPLRVF